jgi:hypothetical protein
MWGFRKLTVEKFDKRQVSGIAVISSRTSDAQPPVGDDPLGEARHHRSDSEMKLYRKIRGAAGLSAVGRPPRTGSIRS